MDPELGRRNMISGWWLFALFLVLFGGTFGGTLSTNFNDTWVWDGTNWTQKSPITSPPGRFWHAMA